MIKEKYVLGLERQRHFCKVLLPKTKTNEAKVFCSNKIFDIDKTTKIKVPLLFVNQIRLEMEQLVYQYNGYILICEVEKASNTDN